MRDALRKLKPDRFEDIIAIVALYRPGPMDNIDAMSTASTGARGSRLSASRRIEPILQETYGVIIYQEQVMQIAQVLSGYSLGEADLLRRAMGKKIKKEMTAQKRRFIEGAVANGVDRGRAEYIFELVAKFAGYGFNKSHAAAYALIAYQTAYLKANYPVEFLAASMTLDIGNTDKLNGFAQEARRLGIAHRAAVDQSLGGGFIPSEGAIRYSLAALKNVGRQAVEHICAKSGRQAARSATSRTSRARINPRLVNKRALETLAAAGAFDELGLDRATAFANVDRMIAAGNRSLETSAEGQDDLFAGAAAACRRRSSFAPPSLGCRPTGCRANSRRSASSSPAIRSTTTRTCSKRSAPSPGSNSPPRRGRAGWSGTLAGTVLSRPRAPGQERQCLRLRRLFRPDRPVRGGGVLGAAGGLTARCSSPATPVLLDVEAEADGENVKVRVQRLVSLDRAAEARHAGMKIYVEDARALAPLAEQVGDRAAARASFGWCCASTTSRARWNSCCRRASMRPRSSEARSSWSSGRGRDQRPLGRCWAIRRASGPCQARARIPINRTISHAGR